MKDYELLTASLCAGTFLSWLSNNSYRLIYQQVELGWEIADKVIIAANKQVHIGI